METANTNHEGGTYSTKWTSLTPKLSRLCFFPLSHNYIHTKRTQAHTRRCPAVENTNNVSQDHWGPCRDRWLATEKQPRGEAERYRDKKDRDRQGNCCCVVTRQLRAGQLGSGVPDSVDLTHLGEWRENSAVTDFLA